MAENNSETGVLAFLLGGAVGVTLGLLLAPRSGAETREKLADWLEQNREKTREGIEHLRENVGEKKDKISAAWEAGKKAYRESAS
jgi:gas vesicle protein